MEAVTIHDMRLLGGGQFLAVDLIDVLRLFEPEVHALSWKCAGVWCTSENADEFNRASEAGVPLDGKELLRLASGAHQVIDGEFVGTPRGGTVPRLVIVAEDSTYYLVASPEPEFLDRVRRHFSDVRASPEWAEQHAEPSAAPDRGGL